MRLLLASTNRGKIEEIQKLLHSCQPDLEVLGLDRFPELQAIPETGRTFAENALLKAATAAERTGLVSLADDSGLEVDALDGAPGVHSARYSGPEATDRANNDKLLHALRDVPAEKRTARFRCVLAARTPGGESLLADGSWEGFIAEEPRGEHGFGYDPLFIDLENGLTAAEMDQPVKNARSHRGRALQDFLNKWPAFLARIEPELSAASR
jgi:XTP/dITP diphosphohydrolase